MALTSLKALLAFVLLLSSVESSKDNLQSQNGVIKAFVIPHSHMDVGWVYTVEESMKAYAANVYSTVVKNLVEGGHRRFIAVEQEFFRLWWDTIADYTQKLQVHQLVQNGQLEFIIGGQVMHDEAVSEYTADIEQLTEGHGSIYETFGVRPQFSWHVDPFGASAATPTLFAMAGFNGHLMSRIDYDKKNAMQKSKGLQFVWQGSPSHGSKLQMFTHVMDQYSYCTPGDIPFSEKSGFYWNGYVVFPEPPSDGIYPNMSLPVNASNIKQYADYMVNDIKHRAAWFKAQHLLWPWGCDKQFFNATVQFKNMDPLMDYINQHSAEYGVTVQYATVGEYFQAVHNTNTTWDIKKSGDFLPYSSDPHSAWTGFYASHSNVKSQARRSQATLKAVESLFTIYNKADIKKSLNNSWIFSQIKKLTWASAEVQHHDGITGTHSPQVGQMYMDHLKDGQNSTLNAMTGMMSDMVASRNNLQFVELNSDRGNDMLAKSNNTIPVVVYNPLGWQIKRYIHVNVSTHLVAVRDSSSKIVPAQVNSPSFVGDKYHLYFYAELPPVGYNTYFITIGNDSDAKQHHFATEGKVHKRPIKNVRGEDYERRKNRVVGKTTVISNQCYDVTFDDETNLLYSITDKTSNKTVKVDSLFKEYNARYDVTQGVSSTTYTFRPMGSAQNIGSDRVELHLVKGHYVKEARQNFYSFIEPNTSRYSVVFRLYDVPPQRHDTNAFLCGHIELQYRIGPLFVNKELITRFTTNLSTDKILYSDENGYQTLKRTYRTDATESIAQNYYPMVSTAYIQDDKEDMRLTLLSDSSHGVSSLGNGMIEVMLHRRLINNEAMTFNFNLTVNDTSVVTPTFGLLLRDKAKSSYLQHKVSAMMENPPVVLAVNQSGSHELSKWRHRKYGHFIFEYFSKIFPTYYWRNHYRTFYSGVLEDLPANLHLLTLKTPGWTFSADHQQHLKNIQKRDKKFKSIEPNFKRVLLRLHHMFAEGEHPHLSNPATVDLQELLSPLGNVVNVEERSLTAIWSTKDLHRWTWNTQGSPQLQEESEENLNSSFVVTLNPKDIKTYFIDMAQ
ncbi:epididymis-specific alpha-mannosidase-like [Glandiceps talaboti]